MMFSNINPYMWDNSSDEVTSPVAEVKLGECKSAKRRVKRSIDINNDLGLRSHKTEIELKLDKRQPSYVNASRPDKYGMVYHLLNVTGPPAPILLSVYPLGNRWKLYPPLTFQA